jgi:hypothetical protein
VGVLLGSVMCWIYTGKFGEYNLWVSVLIALVGVLEVGCLNLGPLMGVVC